MKKILCLLLSLLIIFSLGACQEAAEVLDDAIELAGELNEIVEDANSLSDTGVEPQSSETKTINGTGETSDTGADTQAPESQIIDENGIYTTKEDVALFLYTYGHLPDNFITKSEARDLGWEGGSLEPYAPGKCIGGDRFGNYEELLPTGHNYYECDIDTLGAESRGAKRIVFSDDGLIYYTEDHYESFELLYSEE